MAVTDRRIIWQHDFSRLQPGLSTLISPMPNPHYYHVLFSPRLGGASAVAIKIASRLTRAGRLGGVLVPDQGPAATKLREHGITAKLYPLDQIMSHWWPIALVGNLRLSNALAAWQRNIVHFHLPLLYRAARFSLGRCLSVVHVQIEESPAAFSWAFREPPTLIVTCARFLESAVRSSLPVQYQETQKIAVLSNAVDVERLTATTGINKQVAKRAIGAPLDRPLILMTANLAPHKGQLTAIRTVARLKALGITVNCWLAGEDREQAGYDSTLLKVARSEGVDDRVKLLGFRTDVEKLYGAADFLLLPSTQEGLPLTILEAQASGVPVLAAPTAGIPEVITDGQTGWLIAANDVEGYAQRIKTLLEKPMQRYAAAESASTHVRKYHNWTDYVNRMLQLYETLLV